MNNLILLQFYIITVFLFRKKNLAPWCSWFPFYLNVNILFHRVHVFFFNFIGRKNYIPAKKKHNYFTISYNRCFFKNICFSFTFLVVTTSPFFKAQTVFLSTMLDFVWLCCFIFLNEPSASYHGICLQTVLAVSLGLASLPSWQLLELSRIWNQRQVLVFRVSKIPGVYMSFL